MYINIDIMISIFCVLAPPTPYTMIATHAIPADINYIPQLLIKYVFDVNQELKIYKYCISFPHKKAGFPLTKEKTSFLTYGEVVGFCLFLAALISSFSLKKVEPRISTPPMI